MRMEMFSTYLAYKKRMCQKYLPLFFFNWKQYITNNKQPQIILNDIK
jgi:hypothetical protein